MRKKEKSPGIDKKVLLTDVAVFGILLFIDQFTKYLAILHLKDKPSKVLIRGVLELQYVENTGMAFSLFQDRKVLILCLGVLVLAAILFFLYKLPGERKFRAARVLLAAIVAGALGNMIDRFRYDFVVDFIAFVLIRYPVFNVADCYIVVSAILLFILFMFVYKDEDLEWMSSVLK